MREVQKCYGSPTKVFVRQEKGMAQPINYNVSAYFTCLSTGPFWTKEPRQANLCLRAFRHDKF